MPNTCLIPYLLVIFCLDKNFDHPDVNVGTAAAQEPDSLEFSVPGFPQAGALAVESVEHSVQPEDLLDGLLGGLFQPASVDQVDEAARHDVLAGKIELKMNSSCSMKYTLCTICGNSFRIPIEAKLHEEVFHMHYRVSSKTVPTWFFALLTASTHTNCKGWDIFAKFRKFAT